MDQCVTTILLAPSGSGKTTRVKMLQDSGIDFLHINRDGITSELFEKNGIDGRTSMTVENRNRINELLVLGEKEYYARLEKNFADNVPHILIDYPPGGMSQWVDKTIQLNKSHRRKTIVEGIYVDPIVGLSRILERDSTGLEDIRALDYLNPDRVRFTSWLRTYKNMPQQFMPAAEIADEARLFDNNAPDRKPIVVAEWLGGKLQKFDESAFVKFMDLQKVQVETARFSATPTGSRIEHGRPVHSFSVGELSLTPTPQS